jgi:hypothetical protein
VQSTSSVASSLNAAPRGEGNRHVPDWG